MRKKSNAPDIRIENINVAALRIEVDIDVPSDVHQYNIGHDVRITLPKKINLLNQSNFSLFSKSINLIEQLSSDC